ncbi:hypothetical protein ACIBQ1_27530 [Nonomuraea sp. NPDC050153]|uniref:hypothetical protein n=1 Tax=Nonomuraea sp. NPDC050153 TaxID=3364359 RepID=UPI00378B093F
MTTTWIGIAQLTFTAILLVRMVIVGFFQPVGRVFSWAMFTRGSYITFEFTGYDSAGRRHVVDALDLTPSHGPAVTVRRLERMAAYLEQTYTQVSGEGTIMNVAGTRPIRIEDGHVVL